MEEQITIAKLQDQLAVVNQKLEQLEGKLASEIAAREKAEERLQKVLAEAEVVKQANLESEERYKLLLDSTHDVVYAVTPEGIMTYLGPQMSLFGYAPEELISKNFIEFVALEQRQEVLDKFKTGTAAGESFPTQFQWINKDGSRTWVEVVGKTVFDESGEPRQQIGVIRDIEERKRQDEEKERLLLLLDTLDGECFIKDKDGIYQYINRAFEEQFSIKKEDVIGKDDVFVFGPEATAMLRENDQRIMASKKPEAVEESTTLQNGKFVVYLTNKTPIFDEGGAVTGICGVGVDITHHKEIEEQLRLSEEKYRVLVEKSHDVVYAVGIDGTISYISQQMAQYGYTPDDIIGKPVLQFIAPEDREKNRRKFQELVATGSSEPVRLRWINKDGTIAWVEVVANTVYDDSGQPVQRVGVMRDITYQMQIEDQLRQSEEKYRSLVEQITEVIYSINLEGEVTYISPAIETFLGYSPAEVVGQPFVKFIFAEDLPSARYSFGQLSTGTISGPQEYRFVTKSGQIRWMQTSSHPDMEGDQVVGLQGVLMDITDRKTTEMQLKREAATAERERLARELHDSVTQTLYSVAAIAEVLPRIWERNQEAARQGLADLSTLTHAALAEMRTLLLELRPGVLEKQNMAELLPQLARGLEGRTRMPISLSVDEDCSMPVEVQFALYRITQEALNNIVKHARATQAQIRLDCKPGMVELRISDNGVGFNPQIVTSHRLGLDIMRERAQDVGAVFEIDSQSDIGTHISVVWHEQLEG